MRAALVLVACVLSVIAAGAYALQQKGLLSAQVLRSVIFERDQKKEASQAAMPMEMAASLREQEKQLEQRYQEASRLDERVKRQRDELELEMAKLDAQLKTLQRKPDLQVVTDAGGQRMVELVKIYEGMEPEGTASILERLPDRTVAEILLQMRRRQASQVMESLSIDKGVAVSARLLPDVSEIIDQQIKKVER
jgi:flagellar motility protein MotE (MotC chaperone)